MLVFVGSRATEDSRVTSDTTFSSESWHNLVDRSRRNKTFYPTSISLLRK